MFKILSFCYTRTTNIRFHQCTTRSLSVKVKSFNIYSSLQSFIYKFSCTYIRKENKNKFELKSRFLYIRRAMKPDIHKTPKYILDLNSKEKREFLNSFDTFITDCDDVLWRYLQPLEGSGEAIKLLEKSGKHCVYVSNNSMRSDEEYDEYFRVAGIDYKREDLFHPRKTIISYLRKINFDGLIYCIGTKTFISEMKAAGFRVIDGPDVLPKEHLSILKELTSKDPEPVKAVVIDVDLNVSSIKLTRAQMYLYKDPECLFLTGFNDKFYHINGATFIGPGSFVNLIAEANNKTPTMFGKPGKDFGEIIIENYKIDDPKRVLMVGDMIEQDIGFGKVNGFQTMLVLSGCTKLEDFENPKFSKLIPDFYANSIMDIVTFFNDLN